MEHSTPGTAQELPSSSRPIPLWVVFLLAIAVGGLANRLARTPFQTPDTVEFHRAALRNLVLPPATRLNNWPAIVQYIGWTLHGRRNPQEIYKLKEQHTQALERLGYLQRRTFVLKHQMGPPAQAMRQLTAMSHQRIAKPPGSELLTQIGCQDSWTINVVAPSNEIPVWEEIIRQFDSAAH